ncbi:hypothetical protein SH661x_000574 [Planctomicrobium sp. SH661]|uniref:hypothetical protein n=1 Tax=Planctomicrobium sp. SH661 TaxID=3448124 RepID=UPI003F5B0951
MPPVRYLVAIVLAALIVAGGFFYVAWVRQSFLESVRAELRAQKAANSLPPELQDVDIETFVPNNMGFEVSSSVARAIIFADFLSACWAIWVPLVFTVCLGGVAVFHWLKRTRS